MSSKTKNLPAHLALPAPRRLNNAWRLRLKALALPALIILVLEIVVRVGRLPSYQMPAPSDIALTLRDLAEGALWKHISASLLRVLLGFAIGASLALVFAAWVGLSRGSRSLAGTDIRRPAFDSQPGLGTAVVAVAGDRRRLRKLS